MESRGWTACGAGDSSLSRNDAGLARRTWLDDEYDQSATVDRQKELAAGDDCSLTALSGHHALTTAC
jgi:hypothetical protein